MRVRRGLMMLGLLVVIGISVRFGLGQDASDAGLMTLHAYTDLVEMPVLVLNLKRERLVGVDEGQFRVSLNAGRQFRPTHVRQEGDDPLTVAILIDGDEHRNRLLDEIPEGVASMVAGSLQPQDHVVVYALDCGRVRHTLSLPAASRELERAVKLLLLHQPVSGEVKADLKACKTPLHLWNAMAYVMRDLATQPGRRVLLSVGDGFDGGSALPWTSIRSFAAQKSITLFQVSIPSQRPHTDREVGDPTTALCELSGGMRLWSSTQELDASLSGFVRMLRERYILDFPRPTGAEGGVVNVEVMLLKRAAFIRPAGVEFPVVDKGLMNDPLTVRSDPKRTPEIGGRRPLMH